MSDAERYTYATAPERRERVVQFVTDQGFCTIAELSRSFEVSEMTIRRDVTRLVRDGRLRGFHGGVGSLSPQEMLGRDYRDRDQKMSHAKHAIAASAATVVEPGGIIAIDAGTTSTRLAELLPTDRGIRVVTHSLSAITVLATKADIEVTALGGLLHPESLSFAGPSTLTAISNLQIDVFFLAASGLSERGAFCGTGFDAITKRALIEVSSRVVLVADSSKFEISAMVKICGWDAIDSAIIDSAVPDAAAAVLFQNGVKVELV